MKFNIAGGDVLHSPGGSWTKECHADSKNMILSKPASIRPPTEPISPCVLGSHRETFVHPTGCAVNGSPNSAFFLFQSAARPPPLTPLFRLAGDEGESPRSNLIQHRTALWNQLTYASCAGWTSMPSFTPPPLIIQAAFFKIHM